jgi:hypothetical protein
MPAKKGKSLADMLSATKKAELLSSAETTSPSPFSLPAAEYARDHLSVIDSGAWNLKQNGSSLLAEEFDVETDGLQTESSMIGLHQSFLDIEAASSVLNTFHEDQDGTRALNTVENVFHDNIRLGIENAFSNVLSIGTRFNARNVRCAITYCYVLIFSCLLQKTVLSASVFGWKHPRKALSFFPLR